MGTGGGPKAKKELLSSARKRRAAEQKAAEQKAAEQKAAEQLAAEEFAAEQLVFGKQLPSVAGPRGKRQCGGVRPPSPDAGGGRAREQGQDRAPARAQARAQDCAHAGGDGGAAAHAALGVQRQAAGGL